MIYDCFTFFNELDLLDIRLHELSNVVDKFVLIESTVTFTNKKKPLYYKENRPLFKEFNDKIIHVIVKDSPNTTNPWEIERFQFNAIRRGLKSMKNNDTILISCVDEIPKAKSVTKWMAKYPELEKVFLQKLYYYFLNYVRADRNYWEGTRMISVPLLRKYNDMYDIRKSKANIAVKDGGWHFSYIGGIEMIKAKIQSFSHQEFNKNRYLHKKNIELAIRGKKDLFGRFILFKIDDDKNLPLYVQKNKIKFSKLFKNEKKNSTENLTIFLKKLSFRIMR